MYSGPVCADLISRSLDRNEVRSRVAVGDGTARVATGADAAVVSSAAASGSLGWRS